jgi:hypothetical protein
MSDGVTQWLGETTVASEESESDPPALVYNEHFSALRILKSPICQRHASWLHVKFLVIR